MMREAIAVRFAGLVRDACMHDRTWPPCGWVRAADLESSSSVMLGLNFLTMSTKPGEKVVIPEYLHLMERKRDLNFASE